MHESSSSFFTELPSSSNGAEVTHLESRWLHKENPDLKRVAYIIDNIAKGILTPSISEPWETVQKYIVVKQNGEKSYGKEAIQKSVAGSIAAISRRLSLSQDHPLFGYICITTVNNAVQSSFDPRIQDLQFEIDDKVEEYKQEHRIEKLTDQLDILINADLSDKASITKLDLLAEDLSYTPQDDISRNKVEEEGLPKPLTVILNESFSESSAQNEEQTAESTTIPLLDPEIGIYLEALSEKENTRWGPIEKILQYYPRRNRKELERLIADHTISAKEALDVEGHTRIVYDMNSLEKIFEATSSPVSDRELLTALREEDGFVFSGNLDENSDWALAAKCRTIRRPDIFFLSGTQQNEVKVFCRSCSVRAECLADALDNRISFGVWGGMTERERRALLKNRPDVASWRDMFEAARAAQTSENGA